MAATQRNIKAETNVGDDNGGGDEPTARRLTKREGDGGVSAYIVTFDVFGYLRPKVGKPGQFDHMRGFLGQTVMLTPEQAERGLAAGAIAKPDDAPEVRASVEALAGPVADDSQLKDMSAVELIAYVGQHPEEARRVYDFEAGNLGRPTVLKATGLQGEANVAVPDSGIVAD